MLTEQEQANEFIKTYGSKELAKKVCEELANRLPNVNFVPPVDRLTDDNYMQYWAFTIPHQIDIL